MRTRLSSKAAGSASVKFGGALLSAAVTVLLARLLGAEGLGIYALAYASVTVIGIPARLGLPSLLVREIAAYVATGRDGMAKGVMLWAFGIGVWGSCLIAGVAAGVVLAWPGDVDPNQRTVLLLALILLPILVVGNLRGSALRGFRMTMLGLLPEHVLRPGIFASILAVMWLMAERALTPSLAMMFHIAAAVAAFFVGGYVLVRFKYAKLRALDAQYERRRWLRSLVPLSLIGGMQVINTRMDLLLLGGLGSAEDVGVYRVCVQMAVVSAFGLQAINLVVAPYFSALYASRKSENLQKLAVRSARWGVCLALPLTILYAILGNSVLEIIFGEEFVAGHWAMTTLALGQTVSAGCGSVVILLNMTGRERSAVQGMALAACINVVGNLLLIPQFGIHGAACATAISVCSWNAFLLFRVWRELGIDASVFSFKLSQAHAAP